VGGHKPLAPAQSMVLFCLLPPEYMTFIARIVDLWRLCPQLRVVILEQTQISFKNMKFARLGRRPISCT
jgi:hypothetical protein